MDLGLKGQYPALEICAHRHACDRRKRRFSGAEFDIGGLAWLFFAALLA